MKKYFYSNSQEKEGPITLDELKQRDIQPKTLIWYEGLEDWVEADSVGELREIFELNPPPFDTESSSSIDTDTYDFESENQDASEYNYAVKKQRIFLNPFSFKGRIRRTEYGLSFIIAFIISIILNNLSSLEVNPILSVAYLLNSWFLLAQGAKRCHDLGNNGLWQIIPFYLFWMIFQDGQKLYNEYGQNPKGFK